MVLHIRPSAGFRNLDWDPGSRSLIEVHVDTFLDTVLNAELPDPCLLRGLKRAVLLWREQFPAIEKLWWENLWRDKLLAGQTFGGTNFGGDFGGK